MLRRTVIKPASVQDIEAVKCPKCGDTALKRVLAVRSGQFAGKLIDHRLDIYRVEMDRCRLCCTLTPTKEGKAKIKRCTKSGTEFSFKNLR
jgi:predicted nucleic-acid-binding Zn-ribbon protein